MQPGDLDGAVRRDLLSLDKNNAETVARHLVMVARLLEEDPEQALEHARAARQRAGRIAVVRETAGVAAYHAGEWAEALSELRTARRMSGGAGLLAVMADCERGLGRPERAIELGRSDEARLLQGDEATELRIVVAGARMDLGQYDQAVVTLQTPDLDPSRTGSAAARLDYAYAEALLAAGREEEALTWFMNAASADLDGETDAEERAADLADPDSVEWASNAAFADDDENDPDENDSDENDSVENDSDEDGSVAEDATADETVADAVAAATGDDTDTVADAEAAATGDDTDTAALADAVTDAEAAADALAADFGDDTVPDDTERSDRG